MSRKLDSTINLYNLLCDILSHPHKYRESSIISSLKSQGSLSRYSAPDKNIYPCSLNTLKARADCFLSGGFEEMNLARTSALKALRPAKATISAQSKPRTLRSDIVALKREIQLLNEEILCYTIALETSLEQARNYAKKTNNIINIQLCEKQQSEIYALLNHARVRDRD
ncbi:hypothetical protein HP436_12700 [Pseudomonas sp. CrR14]|nr:hypothetical protein [Pseudomonas sp. CrR14]